MKEESVGKEMQFRIEGISPLIMHNPQTADSLNPFSKEMKKISKLRNRTDEQEMQLREIEWKAGIYYDAEAGPYIPDVNIMAMIVAGAKKFRKGTAILQGLQVITEINRLEYKGPRALDALWNDKNFVDSRVVKLQKKSSLIRTRPIFKKWACVFAVIYDDEVLDADEVRRAIEAGGKFCGLCDYRPMFGRFRIA